MIDVLIVCVCVCVRAHTHARLSVKGRVLVYKGKYGLQSQILIQIMGPALLSHVTFGDIIIIFILYKED